jgi:ribonuclease BN (tRNA processing enzyme)
VHSTVWDALVLAKEADIKNVVLYHISTRYTDVEIRNAICELAAKLDLKAKVWAALPRRVYWHLLQDKPLWDGGQ